jgi:GAF domain-containing protein
MASPVGIRVRAVLVEDGGSSDPQEVIARQAREIEDLRRRLRDEQLAEELRDSIRLSGVVETIGTPVDHSRVLEMIVAVAAQVLGARYGSLFLIDDETSELVFEVSMREGADDLKGIRIPLGHGIAGLVALSGQPMAVSDASGDPRRASDVAQRTGYTPDSIVCVPLHYQDRVIGVIELLDKMGAPGFDARDVETLGLFANQAAVTIEQSRTRRNLAALTAEALGVFAGLSGQDHQALLGRTRAFARDIGADPHYMDALALARLVRDIAAHGPRETQACRAILVGLADYLRQRPAVTGAMAITL